MTVDVAEIPDGYLDGVAPRFGSGLPTVVRQHGADLDGFADGNLDTAQSAKSRGA